METSDSAVTVMTAQKRQMRAMQALHILQLAGHVIDGTLLDLGCGQGWLTEKFSKAGVYAVGVDRNPELVRFAKREGDNCEFVVSDGGHLPFRDSIFKTVILNDVLEHVPYSDAAALMKDGIRTLSNNGRIYISVMNRWQILEPHLMVPFMTWLPRELWNTVYRLKTRNVGIKYTENYFPYTKAKLRQLTQQSELASQDYTWVYGSEKIRNPGTIGSPAVRTLVKFLKTLKLTGLMIRLADKVSPIILLCKKLTDE